jgi:hypothetical protein
MRIEIKTAAAAWHLNRLRNELTDLWDTLRTELQISILDSDAVSQLIGDTNAIAWKIDVFETDVMVLLVEEAGVKYRFQFQASGEQDEEKMMYGDKIKGEGTVIVYNNRLVMLNLTAALVEPPAERDGEEEAINNCEPEDDHEPEDGPDEDERDGEEEAINNCEPEDDHEPEDGPDEDE